MSLTSLEALRDVRRRARALAEARFSGAVAGVRAAEEQVARCTAREAAHVAGRFSVASARLATLEEPASGNRVRPGLDSPLCQAQLHEAREHLLRAEEVLLVFGRQRAALQLAESVGRVEEARGLLAQAECRVEVVERFLADRADAERVRRRRREERDQDDHRAPNGESERECSDWAVVGTARRQRPKRDGAPEK